VLLSFCIAMSFARSLTYPIAAVAGQGIPTPCAVLTKQETQRVHPPQLSGIYQLQAKLLYAADCASWNACRLRVKDIDFERRAMIVGDTKGDEDRVTMLPTALLNCFRTSAAGQAPAPGGPCKGLRRRLPARCAGAEIS